MTPGPGTPACLHPRLDFGSGGFYLICTSCGVRWAAEKSIPAGVEPDHSRVDPALNGQSRVKV